MILAGIAFIVNGVGVFALGWSLHDVRKEVSRPAPRPGAAV